MLEKDSLNKAIIDLGKDIRLIFVGLELSNLASPDTSLKNRFYKEDHFIKDLNLYLPRKFNDLNNKEITKIWKQFKKIFKNLEIFENLLEFQGYSYQIYTIHFNIIKKEIFNQLMRLNSHEKLSIYIFLKNRDIIEFQNNIGIESLYSSLNRISNQKYDQSITPDIGDILIKIGILFLNSYIDTRKQPSGMFFTSSKYLVEISPIITSYLLKGQEILNILKRKDQFTICEECKSEYPSQEKNCPFCLTKKSKYYNNII